MRGKPPEMRNGTNRIIKKYSNGPFQKILARNKKILARGTNVPKLVFKITTTIKILQTIKKLLFGTNVSKIFALDLFSWHGVSTCLCCVESEVA